MTTTSGSDARIADALDAFSRIVGAGQVVGGADVPTANLTAFERRVAGLVQPTSTADVVGLVRAAAAHGLQLYPVSTGRNWGFGSHLPVTHDAVIMDLSAMRRIRRLDTTLHVVEIEPGVTQGDLYDRLQAEGAGMRFNVTGAGRETSIIGNALDRGIGYFRQRPAEIRNLEVVLADGSVVRTGFGALTDSPLAPLVPDGLGPDITGLFFQSNFGIVTAASFDLMPAPESSMAIVAALRPDASITTLTGRILALYQQGVISAIVHIANHHRIRSTLEPLIRREVERLHGDPVSDTQKVIARRCRAAWSAVIPVLGAKSLVTTQIREITQALKPVAVVHTISADRLEKGVNVMSRFAALPAIRRAVAYGRAIIPLCRLAHGIPTSAALESVCGKSTAATSAHPDAGTGGLIFIAPFIPATPDSIQESLDLVGQIFQDHRLTPFITANVISHRSIELVINASFDRTNPDQIRRAHDCRRVLVEALFERGTPPYRLDINSMHMLQRLHPDYRLVLSRLRQVMDPQGTISPGRYACP